MEEQPVRVRVAAVGDLPAGQAATVEMAGSTVAVFNLDARFYAIDNSCAHRGGPLAEGDVAGTVVTCPWHGWRWDVTTGANTNSPAVRQACYPVSVEDGQVFVELPGRAGPLTG